jgi:hypothetical protein
MQSGATLRVRGDAEFILVFHDKLPSDSEIDRLELGIQTDLADEGIECRICLSPVWPNYLTRLKPHIFGFELVSCGRVIWGDAAVLSLIPPFSSGDIPKEDAFYILSNRVVELLDAWAAGDCYYAQAKLYLDLATSYLLFAGEYAPSYRARAEHVRERAQDLAQLAGSGVAERVAAATEFKLHGRRIPLGPFDEALRYAERIARWELRRMTGDEGAMTEEALLRRWVRRQPVQQRIRGWLFAMRACGWYRGWRWWPRWARLALGGSPRYWTYVTTWQLVSRLSDDSLVTRGYLARLRRCLPVTGDGSALLDWRELCGEIGTNYHTFLEGTRA